MNGREIKKLCPKRALAIPEVAFRNFKLRSFPIGPSVRAVFINILQSAETRSDDFEVE